MTKRVKSGGRTKGTPNKATAEFKETIAELLRNNAMNIEEWLALVANGSESVKPDPAKALDLLAKLAEYAAPKLARTEHVGNAEQPVQTVIRWQSGS